MPIDKFKVTSDIFDSDDLQCKLDTLAPLRKIVDLTIGGAKPVTADQFNEDFSRERVSIIEVNGNKLWDSKEQCSDDNKKFKQAKHIFMDFSTQPNYQPWIYGLNRDILRSAVWEMLSNNYVFDQKTYHFTTELPPSPCSQLKLSRTDQQTGIQLILEFSSQIRELFDVSRNKSLKLNTQGVLYPVLEGTFSPAQDPILCEINLTVILDISNDFDTQRPEVTIELTVRSDCPKFRYIGGWASEIMQLENVDILPERVPAPIMRYSTPSSAIPAVNAIVRELESANRNIGIMIERIVSIDYSSSENLIPIVCSTTLQLFNESLKIALLKTQHSDNLPNKLSGLNCSSTYLKSLAIQMSNRKGPTGNPLLIEKAWLELINIFYKLQDVQISQLLAVFYRLLASKIKSDAFFIHQNFKDFAKEYHIPPLAVREATYILFVAFESIKAALKSVQTEKKISMFGFELEGAIRSITTIEEVPLAFKQYLQSLALRTSGLKLLDDHLLSNLDFPPITTIKFSEEEIAEIQETYDNSDLVSTRGFQVLHLKLPEFKERLSCCPFYPAEKIAALLERNPAIKGLNDGSAIYFTIRQLLSLYPNTRIAVLPYLAFANIAAGIIGITIGRNAVLHPEKPMSLPIRLWEATTDGLVVCVFNIGSAINIYLAIHYPNNTDPQHPITISDQVFWGEIASIPLALAVAYTIWHSISHNSKERWFSQNLRAFYLKKCLDVAAKFLFYGGIIDISLSNFYKNQGSLAHQLIPPLTAIAAIFLALGHLTRCKERLNVAMIYLTAINFSYMLIKELYSKETVRSLIYTQIGFWTLASMGSLYFTLKNSIEFVKKYTGTPEIVVSPLPENSDELLNRASAISMTTITAQQYHTIQQADQKGERTSLLTFAKQIHDQQYQATSSSATLTSSCRRLAQE